MLIDSKTGSSASSAEAKVTSKHQQISLKALESRLEHWFNARKEVRARANRRTQPRL